MILLCRDEIETDAFRNSAVNILMGLAEILNRWQYLYNDSKRNCALRVNGFTGNRKVEIQNALYKVEYRALFNLR